MKVCFLTSNYPPEIQAGTEMVVVALARQLRRAGLEVVVITTCEIVHEGQDLREEEFEGVRVWRIFKKLDEWDQHGLHRPRLLQMTGELLRRERPDLLHAHSLSAWGGGQLQQARDLGIPTVLTFHDLWVTCPRYFRLPPQGITCPSGDDREPCVACVNQALEHEDLDVVREALLGRDREVRAEVAAATVCTAPSETTARMIAEHLPWTGVTEVIPHGLLGEPPMVHAAPPEAEERVRIGTFGNLVEQKGVLDLVQAVAGLDCELHLHGAFLVESFEAEVRAAAADKGIELICHGAYDGTAAHPATRLHLAVFPSKCQETYGLVVDEALAHGVPVVVSDQGALAERAQVGGVRVTELSKLARVLHDLVEDREQLAALRTAIPSDLPTMADAAARYRALYSQAKAVSERSRTSP